jgi:hypothetical protein
MTSDSEDFVRLTDTFRHELRCSAPRPQTRPRSSPPARGCGWLSFGEGRYSAQACDLGCRVRVADLPSGTRHGERHGQAQVRSQRAAASGLALDRGGALDTVQGFMPADEEQVTSVRERFVGDVPLADADAHADGDAQGGTAFQPGTWGRSSGTRTCDPRRRRQASARSCTARCWGTCEPRRRMMTRARQDSRRTASTLWPCRTPHGWVSTGVQYSQPLTTAYRLHCC